jgi:hypothetical protein
MPLSAEPVPAATPPEPGPVEQGQPFARGDFGFAAFEAGSRALRAALALAEARADVGTVSALLLCRAAVLWFLGAQLARATRTASPALPADRWAALQELPGMTHVLERLSAEQRGAAPALLAATFDESGLWAASASDTRRDLAALQSIAFALGDPLENDAAKVRRERRARRARRAALFCLLALPLGYDLVHALRRPNLALHQPVSVQGSDPTFAIDPARVVDGDRMNLGFHTVAQGVKSVTIDLQALRRIQRIEVYNRIDCCLDRAVPLTIQVSSDGQSFAPVARRHRRFALWKAKFSPLEARWVRLVHEGDQPFHLSEIEVY